MFFFSWALLRLRLEMRNWGFLEDFDGAGGVVY